MSVAFPMALFMGTLGSFVILRIVRWFRGKPSDLGCLIALLALPVLCVVSFPLVWAIGNSEGFDLSRDEAMERDVCSGFPNLTLPPNASQIDFRRHFHQMKDVDFTIAEDEFLDWCSSHDWKPTPITEGRYVCPLNDARYGAFVTVTDGYEAVTVPIEGDFGGTVVYDRQLGRAFYRFSSY